MGEAKPPDRLFRLITGCVTVLLEAELLGVDGESIVDEGDCTNDSDDGESGICGLRDVP